MTNHGVSPAEFSPAQFDVDHWLQHRLAKINYLMVEIGHGAYPAALKQDFHGRRAYIGAEVWANEVYARGGYQKLQALQADRSDQNIFFYPSTEVQLGHSDEAATILPNGVADEVLLSNVFGENYVREEGGIAYLLSEGRRLLTPDGKVVIRETAAPEIEDVWPDLGPAGLQVDGIITPEDEAWDTLETLYAPQYPPELARIRTDPAAYYLFLSATPGHATP